MLHKSGTKHDRAVDNTVMHHIIFFLVYFREMFDIFLTQKECKNVVLSFGEVYECYVVRDLVMAFTWMPWFFRTFIECIRTMCCFL